MWTIYVPDTGCVLTQGTLNDYYLVESNAQRKILINADQNIPYVKRHECWIFLAEQVLTPEQCRAAIAHAPVEVDYAVNLATGESYGSADPDIHSFLMALPQVFGSLSV